MMQGKAVGASARLWRRFFPAHTEIWVAEYDGQCVHERAEDLKPYNLHFVLGRHGGCYCTKQSLPRRNA